MLANICYWLEAALEARTTACNLILVCISRLEVVVRPGELCYWRMMSITHQMMVGVTEFTPAHSLSGVNHLQLQWSHLQ